MVQAGSFRQDLWYRMNVAVIRIPALRERPEDIELLAEHFLREQAAISGKSGVRDFSESALATMKSYAWPGNVRQLRAAVERASVVATGSLIELQDLPMELVEWSSSARKAVDAVALSTLTWNQALERGRDEFAKRYLEEVLCQHEGRVADAAQHAGVERESFYRLMRRYGVEPDIGRKRGLGSNRS